MNIKLQMVGFYTLVRRELIRIFRIWVQALLGPVVNIFLYFLILGNIVGQRIGLIHGVSYLNFITPALIILAAMNSSYSQVSSSFFIVRFQRNIEEMLMSPISNLTLMLSFIVAGILRGLIVAAILTFIIVFFFHVHLDINLKVITDIILVNTLFSCAGLLNGIFAKDFDDIALVPLFIITPLGYLGGAFYTIDMLPLQWQNIAKLNPLFYILQTFRAHTLNIHNDNTLQTIFIISSLIFTLFSTAYFLIKKAGFLRL